MQVFYYSGNTIFKSAGLSAQGRQWATIGAGVVNFAMAVISIPVMANINRRITIQISLSLTTVCLVLLGISINLIVRFL